MIKPVFLSALYIHAPAFEGWHVRQPEADAHPLIPQQVLLHEPLHADPFGKIHTAANGRNPDRFVWWHPWYRTTLPGVYHAYERNAEGMYLLVFHHPKAGHTQPFCLLATEVTNAFPKESHLWGMVAEVVANLPPIRAEPDPVRTLAY